MPCNCHLGVRAANGVIVINTNSKRRSGKVSYSFGLNVGERLTYKKLELMIQGLGCCIEEILKGALSPTE